MFSLFQNEDDEEEELAEQAHKQKLLDMISSQPKVCSYRLVKIDNMTNIWNK